MSQHGCPERLSNRSKTYVEDGSSQPTMEVLVETLTGTAFEMTVSPSDTIFAIKSKIFRVEGIPVSQQHLLYNLKELDDAASLRELSIGSGARLRLVLAMRGGPINTRRLQPPPSTDTPWGDIERLFQSNHEESEECIGSGAGSCKVTVLVFREGDKVNMLRVLENEDGTYSPITPSKYSSTLKSLVEGTNDDGLSGSVQDNAVTMGKMLELRRRMEALTVTRSRVHAGSTSEVIQKTRSEETLSVPSLLDDATLDYKSRNYSQYSEAEDTFAPLYDRSYTKYDYDCSFADRYTLLPPIRSRTDSDQSINEAIALESDRIKLSDALAGSILVKSSREDEAGGLLESGLCLDGTSVEECHIRQESPPLATKNLTPISTADYCPLVGGSSSGWVVRGFGSHTHLSASPAPAHPPPPLPAPLSASALHLRALPPAPRHPPLSDAVFSSSTSDLEKLKRNRILPALSRHRNREHLHLSDEGLDMPHRARNLEVGSERKQRRIKKVTDQDAARPLFRFDNSFDSIHLNEDTDFAVEIERGDQVEKVLEVKTDNVKKISRIRCGFCKKRLSIATVHKCRCGVEFCAPHRYAEVHGCAYDYKANAHQYLQRANPLVSAPKLPKI